MQETWKAVQGYEGLYEISDLGRVRRLVDRYGRKLELIMTPSVDRDGYLQVALSKNGNKKTYKIHRLVAFVYVEGYDLFKNQVNHINEVKDDNRAVNLEWCDWKYNNNFGTKKQRLGKSLTNRKDISKVLIQLTLDYKFVAKWPSSREAHRQGFNHGSTIQCCLHKLLSAYGFRWLYLSEYEEICFKVITSHHPYHLALPYRA